MNRQASAERYFLICIVLFTLGPTSRGYIRSPQRCANFLAGKVISALPLERIAKKIREDLGPDGPGFVILDTEALFPLIEMQMLHKKLSTESSYYRLRNRAFQKSKGELSIEDSRWFRQLAAWLEILLNTHLPNGEKITFGKREFELFVGQKGGTLATNGQLWHTHEDVYFYAVVALLGSGTFVKHRGKTLQVPRGKILIFSGGERKRHYRHVIPTKHKGPFKDEDRLLGRFEFVLREEE